MGKEEVAGKREVKAGLSEDVVDVCDDACGGWVLLGTLWAWTDAACRIELDSGLGICTCVQGGWETDWSGMVSFVGSQSSQSH